MREAWARQLKLLKDEYFEKMLKTDSNEANVMFECKGGIKALRAFENKLRAIAESAVAEQEER